MAAGAGQASEVDAAIRTPDELWRQVASAGDPASRSLHLPLAASLAGHAVVIALLALFFRPLAPAPRPVFALTNAIEVMLVPPMPPTPAAQPAPPPPQPPPLVKGELPPSPPPLVKAEPPPSPPARRLSPRRIVRRLPPRRPPPHRLPPPEPVREAQPEAPPASPVRTAAIARPIAPPRPAAPVVSAAYGSALSGWLEGHRHYPESARERGEEGRALLRFRVARSGRVLSYAVVRSSGYPDLDAAIETMMRGAILPPFPPDMPVPDIQVTVLVRFALAR
jgi:periplasmic protein TonB